MKQFYLIRHAKSSWDNPGLKDIERPLNPRGLRDAPFMAKLLLGNGVRPDRILSSPAVRAHTTARYFAEAQQINPNEIDLHRDIYEAYPEQLMALIRELDEQWKTVFFFGHNPSFTSLANSFTEEYIVNVATCGVVCVESTAKTWNDLDTSNSKVKSYLYPKMYL